MTNNEMFLGGSPDKANQKTLGNNSPSDYNSILTATDLGGQMSMVVPIGDRCFTEM